MSSLSDIRADLAAAIKAETGIKTHDAVPQGVSPTVIFLEPNEPYVEPGDAIGSSQVNLRIWLVTSTSTNAKAADVVDNLIEKVLNVVAGEWVYTVSPPGNTTFVGSEVLPACSITVSKIFDRTN